MNDFAFDTLLCAAAGDVRSERLAAYRTAPPRNIKKILLCAAVAAMLLSMGVFAGSTHFFTTSFAAAEDNLWRVFFTQKGSGAPTLESGDGLYSYTTGWLPEGTTVAKTQENLSSYFVNYRKLIGIKGGGYYTMSVRVSFAGNNSFHFSDAKSEKISTGTREYVVFYDEQANLSFLFFEEAGMAVYIDVQQWERNAADILRFADGISFADEIYYTPTLTNIVE